jgi:hypothetical protein
MPTKVVVVRTIRDFSDWSSYAWAKRSIGFVDNHNKRSAKLEEF